VRINTKTFRDSQSNAIATATAASPGAERRWRVYKVTASYSSAAASGLLQIKCDATVLWELYIAGGFVEDFMPYGLQAPVAGLADGTLGVVTAVLPAGGTGVTGKVNLLVALDQ
jgi:hypothetical protein